jgi:hypothetical protein
MEISKMPRQFYSAEERSSILSVVAAGRKAGQKWAEVHKQAQASDFRGGLQALMVFASKAKQKARKARASSVPVAVIAPAAKPSAFDDIHREIDRIVQERVRAALETAVEVLKKAM